MFSRLAQEREANDLRIPARHARFASTFEEAGIEVIGLQECRLPSQLVVSEGFVMVTSEAWDGRGGCGLWLSTRRAGREHITVVHSSSSVLVVAVRSKTLEAKVVVAQSPVEGHERAEAWWEALGEMLSVLATDVPLYVCIGANGRLGSSTSKHVGSLKADQEIADKGEIETHFVAVSLPEMLRVKRCWVASELDVATVRADHCAVVVDLETMWCRELAAGIARRSTVS